METSIYAFASDLHDEGLDHVLDNVQDRAGLGGVTVAAAYHEGRDVFPHNPVRKVRFLESGAVFFWPDPERWRDVRLRPPASELAEADVLPRLCSAAAERGLRVNAWTVFLHNGALAERHPECAPENAFGDRYVTDLCPANPDVYAYVCALAADVARLGVAEIVSESLHYPPFEHGYAHERYFIPLGPLARYLLGLCFCVHCLNAARGRGVDGERVRRFAREELERVFAGEPEAAAELDQDAVAELADGELGGYVKAREDTVRTLVAAVANAARREGASLASIDLSGAVKGYATGRPTGGPAPELSWQLGVDVGTVAAECDGIEAIAYAADPARLRLDLEAYGSLLPEGRRLSAIVRPMPPDCDSVENLREKVRLVRELGIARLSFYHYGFMRLDALDLIREAIAEA